MQHSSLGHSISHGLTIISVIIIFNVAVIFIDEDWRPRYAYLRSYLPRLYRDPACIRDPASIRTNEVWPPGCIRDPACIWDPASITGNTVNALHVLFHWNGCCWLIYIICFQVSECCAVTGMFVNVEIKTVAAAAANNALFDSQVFCWFIGIYSSNWAGQYWWYFKGETVPSTTFVLPYVAKSFQPCCMIVNTCFENNSVIIWWHSCRFAPWSK